MKYTESQKHTFKYLFMDMITIFNSFFNLCSELFNETAASTPSKQLNTRKIYGSRNLGERIL